jgi:hypothetical protein
MRSSSAANRGSWHAWREPLLWTATRTPCRYGTAADTWTRYHVSAAVPYGRVSLHLWPVRGEPAAEEAERHMQRLSGKEGAVTKTAVQRRQRGSRHGAVAGRAEWCWSLWQAHQLRVHPCHRPTARVLSLYRWSQLPCVADSAKSPGRKLLGHRLKKHDRLWRMMISRCHGIEGLASQQLLWASYPQRLHARNSSRVGHG